MERLEEFLKECYNNLLTKPQTPRGAAIDVDALNKSWKSVEECDKDKLSAIFDKLDRSYTSHLQEPKSIYRSMIATLILINTFGKNIAKLLQYKYHIEINAEDLEIEGRRVNKRAAERLIFDNEIEDEIVITLFFTYAMSYYNYKRPKKEAHSGGLLNSPISTTLALFSDVIGNGRSLEALPARKGAYDHGSANKLQTEVLDENASITLTKTKQTKEEEITTTIIMQLNGADKLPHNVHQRKISRHILTLANQQCYHNGAMSKHYVEFPISDLINDSLYLNDDTARVGFFKAMMILQSPTMFSATTRKIKKTGEEAIVDQSPGLVNLFTGSCIRGNMCRVALNEGIPWKRLFERFTVIPSYHMLLSDKAGDLLEEIFTAARSLDNEAKIKDDKPFNIGFRRICYKLCIPTENEVREKYQKRYRHYIVKQLTDTINELIAVNDPDYSITVHSNVKAPISKYLDTGYLEISIKRDGAYYDALTRMIDRRETKIQVAIDKHERMKANAAAAIKAKAKKKTSKES